MAEKIKARALKAGETVEVGDIIVSSNSLTGSRSFRVRRVTRTLAMVRWNDVAEGSFRRDGVQDGGFVRLRGAGTWDSVSYRAYRPVPVTPAQPQEQSKT